MEIAAPLDGSSENSYPNTSHSLYYLIISPGHLLGDYGFLYSLTTTGEGVDMGGMDVSICERLVSRIVISNLRVVYVCGWFIHQ